MVRRTTKKKAGSVSVNFKGVEIGGQKRIPEDDYLMRVAELTQEEGDKGDYLKWVFKVDEGKHKGATFYVNTSLTPQSLWKLGALLQALGHEVPDDELDLDFDDYIDETLMGVVADEVYEGKKRSRMVDFYSADDAEDDEPEEKPAKKSSRKAKDEDEEEEKPARKSRRRSKDEDDDEEEAPKSKRGAKKSKFSPIASDDVQEMDEDELQDVIDRSGVDVDLDDYSTLRKKRAAVIDALEAADLIDDDGGEEEPEEDDRPTRGKKKPAAKDEEDDEPEEDSAAARRKARRAARKSRG